MQKIWVGLGTATTAALAAFLLLGSMNAQSSTANALRPSEDVSPAPQMTIQSHWVTANTRFSIKLFSHLAQQSSDDTNLLVSPSSVAIALSMTYNGASGETQRQIAQVLDMQGMSLSTINQGNAALENSLETADPEVKVAIANSLWARQDVTFNPTFLQRNQDFYNAEITTLDFANPAAPGMINDWVNRSTAGKIPAIVDDIAADHVLFLINAIYFKGPWTHPFDISATVERPFHLQDGREKSHPMMTQHDRYSYFETDDFQAINLPYGNERLSMVVLLPRESSNLQEFYKTLTVENWQQWMSQFSPQSGMIQLPRFTTEYDVQLNHVLQALGMEAAFDPNQADFSNMSNVSTFIDEVRHKTLIEVTEEGTEAAAATAIRVSQTSASVDPPFQMVCDRPFFYAIQDNQTGAILFMGSVVDPQ